MVPEEEKGRMSPDWTGGLVQCGGRNGLRSHLSQSSSGPARTRKEGNRIEFSAVQSSCFSGDFSKVRGRESGREVGGRCSVCPAWR